jgi:hypothetical protein
MSNASSLFQQYLQVTSSNTLFNDYKDRWQFYLESYMGGSEYRSAGHLVRYQLETDKEYTARLDSTPLDNHCKSVISVYSSFLFRTEPDRDLETLELMDPMLSNFLEDADLEGRSLNAFMKEASIWANVFGHSFILVTKPNVGAVTMADEIAMGVRPYVSLITPLTVIDWQWSRSPLGAYELVYFKYLEEANPDVEIIKEWTKETITTYTVDKNQKTVNGEVVEANGLGLIPAIQLYASRSPVRGIGSSSISDIADQQRAIYNEYSEIEQLVRLTNHPALVKTTDVEAGAGAGAVIQMPDNMDPGLKPYLLEPSGNGLDAIYASIAARVDSIDKMANTGAIRTNQTRQLSGVAMRTEFELLNAKLAEMADHLELAEEQMWQFYCLYQGTTWDGKIHYADSFNIQDDVKEFEKLMMAKGAATDPAVLRVIDEQILELLDEEKSRLPFIDPNPQPGRTYPDGEAIADSLPNAYQDSANPEVPEGQNCGNCEYYKPGELYCTKFDAPVRAVYWCAKWEPVEDYS